VAITIIRELVDDDGRGQAKAVNTALNFEIGRRTIARPLIYVTITIFGVVYKPEFCVDPALFLLGIYGRWSRRCIFSMESKILSQIDDIVGLPVTS